MVVLVTGATGFIGSRLCLAAMQRGHRVRAFGQENQPAEAANARSLRSAGAELHLASVTDRAAVARAVSGVDTVIHLAAAQHEANVPDQRFWDVNVQGTRTVVEAAIEAGVTRFVHGSTIGVFGGRPGVTVHEDSPLEPTNIYGRTKLEGERIVLSQRDRIEVLIARISETYGPGDRRLLKLFRGLRKGRFFLVGDGANLHHPIFIDDLLEGLLLSATVPAESGATFVLAGRDSVATREMVGSVARALGTTPPSLRLPLPLLWGSAALMEGMFRPLGIQPPLHRRRMNFFVTSFSFSGEAARRHIGFEPRVAFADGARETARWYRESGLLEGNGVALGNLRGIGRNGGAAEGNGHEGNGTLPALGGEAGGVGHVAPVGDALLTDADLAARMEPFDSFWEAPEDVEKGFRSFAKFYSWNYLDKLPARRDVALLVISCGPGYLVDLLTREGYTRVLGIDSDPDKIRPGLRRGLNCRAARAFAFLREGTELFDVIFCEQELNHLTKREMVAFLGLCRNRLRDGGLLVVHGLNGANPITGAEALAQNFDHFNSFTEYSLRQVLTYSGFAQTRVFPLHLYVFTGNPMNYAAWAASSLMSFGFRVAFILYGKHNKLWSKKIAATCVKPGEITEGR